MAAVRHYAPFLLVTVLLSIPFRLKPENFAVDDGYFYLQIARNIANGLGSTFNGWLPTNGYHPLWMLVCCACAWVTTNTSYLLHAVTTVQDALTVLSILLLVWIARSSNLRGAVFGCAVLWFMSDVVGIWRLLETSLSLTLQLISLILVVYRPRTSRQRMENFGIGVLLGLTMLARLDLVFFVFVLLVFPWWSNRAVAWPRRAAASAWQCLGAAAMVAPYLAWNYSHFHHLAPVSGAIKSTFPHMHGIPKLGFDTKIVVLGVVLNLVLFLRKQRTPFERVCLATALATTLHLVYCLLFGSLWPWYLTTGDLNLALALIWMGNRAFIAWRMPSRLETAALAAISVTLLTVASVRVVTNISVSRLRYGPKLLSLSETYEEPRKAFAERLRATFPQGTRFFIFDSPGSVAYYSGMSITPADGLVLDYEYNADLLHQGFSSYAHEHAMQYMIVPMLRDGEGYSWLSTQGIRHGATQFVTVDVPLTGTPAGTVAMTDSSMVMRNPTIQPSFEAYLPEIGVWRLP